MKTRCHFPLAIAISAIAALTPAARTAEIPINELLRDALYSEEVTRDSEAAANQYRQVISRYETQREFAATALFRLAEVRRKQGNKEEAIRLYQQLVTQFPDSEIQANLSKETLKTLGVEFPDSQNTIDQDADAKELARIKSWEITSPDLTNSGDLLLTAVKNDWLKAASYLLSKGANPNSGNPLAIAAASGNLAICDLLLKSGADPKTESSSLALIEAVKSGHAIITDRLIKEGVDVNHQIPGLESTALAIATVKQDQRMVEKLLAAGAQPNLGEMTSLHFAAVLNNIECCRVLLEAGANPNALPINRMDSATRTTFNSLDPQARSKWEWKPEGGGPGKITLFDTPLTLVIAAGRSTDLLDLLLDKCPDANAGGLVSKAIQSKSAVMVEALLSRFGKTVFATADRPLIYLAAESGNLEIVEKLLDAGADPNALDQGGYPHKKNALTVAAFANNFEMAKRLLDAGAKPDEALRGSLQQLGGNSEYRGPTPKGELLAILIEKFIIPESTGSPAITAIVSGNSLLRTIPLAIRKADAPPPELARLLAEENSPMQWPSKVDSQRKTYSPEKISIWRKGEDARENSPAIIWEGTISQNILFPELEWGDVIHITFDTPPGTETAGINNLNSPDPLLLWNLRRRVSFPIKIEKNGKVEEYQMRGDRIVFDPTRKEVPWCNIVRLVSLLWQDELPDDKAFDQDVEAIVMRKGWPDIQIKLDEPNVLPLESGDHIKVRVKKNAAISVGRTSRIQVLATGLPASKYYQTPAITEINQEENRGPTLVQILADLLNCDYGEIRNLPPHAPDIAAWMPYLNITPRTIWPDPDFSKIRIRRLNTLPSKDNSDSETNGAPIFSETTIKIDLADKIQKFSNGEIPLGSAAEHDFQLQGGDIVEIDLRKNSESKWSGLSSLEETFFSSILRGRIQVKNDNGELSLREFSYLPLRYIDSEAGLLPIRQTGTGDPSVAATCVISPSFRGSVLRGGDMLPRKSGLNFLREGDQVNLSPALLIPVAPPNPPDK